METKLGEVNMNAIKRIFVCVCIYIYMRERERANVRYDIHIDMVYRTIWSQDSMFGPFLKFMRVAGLS